MFAEEFSRWLKNGHAVSVLNKRVRSIIDDKSVWRIIRIEFVNNSLRKTNKGDCYKLLQGLQRRLFVKYESSDHSLLCSFYKIILRNK